MNLLLACALLLQESPETAFKKIEAAIDRAKSVRVLYTLVPASEPQNLSRGTMTLEGESKAKMSADLRSGGSSRVAIFTEFEGGKIKSSIAGHTVDVTGDERRCARTSTSTSAAWESSRGRCSSTGSGPGLRRVEDVVGRPQADVPALGVRRGGEGAKGSKILSYSFTPVFKPMPFTWAKIWYDPRTYRLLRASRPG